MLTGFEERRAAFEEEGVSILAGSHDSQEDTLALSGDKGFSFAHSMSKADAAEIGAWWQPKFEYIQPSEFILTKDGMVRYSSYSDGPIGRMDPEDTLSLVRYLNEQDAKGLG